MLWVAGAGFLFVWFILKFLLHKGGFIHVLLLTAISLFVVQFAAYRKTRYQKLSSGR
jgi:hypothetical protein